MYVHVNYDVIYVYANAHTFMCIHMKEVMNGDFFPVYIGFVISVYLITFLLQTGRILHAPNVCSSVETRLTDHFYLPPYIQFVFLYKSANVT